MSVKATVFNIARGSFHDGPGVRTVIYLKGCNLSCLWCHNPEGQRFEPQLCFAPSKCAGCGACAAACPRGCIRMGDRPAVDFEACRGCGACAQACPSAALTLAGQEMTPENVIGALQSDRAYFRRSGGGATFSGGECLLHREFMLRTLELCRREGIHTLIESAFDVPGDTVRAVIPLAGAVYADIKHFDSAQHRAYTGRGNGRILRNIRLAAGIHGDVTVRVPLVPGVNDSPENLLATTRFAAESGVRGMELLRYNDLAESKYRAIGRTAVKFGGGPQTPGEMEALCAGLNKAAGKERFVFYKK